MVDVTLPLREDLLLVARRRVQQRGGSLTRYLVDTLERELAQDELLLRLEEERGHADLHALLDAMERAPDGPPPLPGDELPESWTAEHDRRLMAALRERADREREQRRRHE